MNIVLKGNINVYEQIVEQYKKYIDLKVYQEGHKLPSCRLLAKELGINPNTVEKAYRVLESEGYIIIIPKKGVYVADVIQNNDSLIKYFEELKSQNISYETLLEVLNKVYGR